jgi:hypothetical protein
MSLFPGRGLLVSMPGAEIASLALPGSLCQLHDVLGAVISSELRAALHLLRDYHVPGEFEIQCLLRPELFLCGRAQAWLRSRTEGIFHHLCLSDGTTLKPLPPFETHIFFYRRAFRESFRALERLFRRAPELPETLHGQINSQFSFTLGSQTSRPLPMYLGALSPFDGAKARLLPFFLNRHSAEDSANQIPLQNPIMLNALDGFSALQYILLTETALMECGFTSIFGHLLIEAFFTPATLLILRLPSVSEGQSSLKRQLAMISASFRKAGTHLPHTVPKNIILATTDLEESHSLFKRWPLEIIVHESYEFWRYTKGFYESAAQVTLISSADVLPGRGFLPHDVKSIYGKNASRRVVQPILLL